MNPNCARENCEGCPGRYLCNCLRVTEEIVIEAIASGTVRSVCDLRASTGAGNGCMACHQRLRHFIDRYSLSMASVAVAG